MNKKTQKKTLPKTSDSTDFQAGDGLSVSQQKAIGALMSERSQRDAARKVGVSEKTIYTWLQSPIFQAALKDAEGNLLDSVVWRLDAGHSIVLDVIMSLMQKSKSDATKLAAAVAWSSMYLKYHEMRDIQERLKILEAALLKK